MKVVVNSDILFTQKLITARLPLHLEKLATECARVDAVIVLPRTALFEVERRQRQLMEGEIAAVERAFTTLRSAGVGFEEKESAKLFALPDLAELFRSIGARVAVEEPLLEDYNDAHRRACLHLPPHPPDTKSDEMRDLVIWVMALRLAQDGGAILLSRDEVHTHDRGDEEADEVGLRRATDVDEALEFLGVESPALKLVRLMLEPIWNDLRSPELPLTEEFRLRKVKDAAFVRGYAGIDKATFKIETSASTGGTLRAEVEITRGEEITSIAFREISIDGQPLGSGKVDILINRQVPLPSSDIDEPLAELRDIIGK